MTALAALPAITAVTAMLAILSVCHSERCRSAGDGERGTPRMLAVNMQIQGILS
jgi:hypothetical protein